MNRLTTEGYELYRDVLDAPPQLEAAIAPAGAAFAEVHGDHLPSFRSLYDPDGSHPSLQGSYMVSCVVYSALTGWYSAGMPFAPPGIAEGERQYCAPEHGLSCLCRLSHCRQLAG